MARIAVLIPVYDAGRFLKECLDSVIGQTFGDFVVFVCDDGSRDESPAILREYAGRDPRIRVLTNPGNLGIVKSRNRLIENIPADAEFVAWLDSDDVMLPDRLARQTAFLETHPEIGGVGSALEIIDESSRTTGSRSYPGRPGDIRRLLPQSNVLAQPAMMLRREVIVRTGLYSETCPVCQDYEYWLRCLESFDFANLREPVLRYRISRGQVKQRKLKLALRLTLKIQRDYYRRNGLRMPLRGVIRQMAGLLLLLLPSAWILWLFKTVVYRKSCR